jgi:hypothetical protein
MLLITALLRDVVDLFDDAAEPDEALNFLNCRD